VKVFLAILILPVSSFPIRVPQDSPCAARARLSDLDLLVLLVMCCEMKKQVEVEF
jgi:hypothetical protein